MDDKLRYLSLVEDVEPLTVNSCINLLYGTAIIVSSSIGQQLGEQCSRLTSLTPQNERMFYEKLFGFLEKVFKKRYWKMSKLIGFFSRKTFGMKKECTMHQQRNVLIYLVVLELIYSKNLEIPKSLKCMPN